MGINARGLYHPSNDTDHPEYVSGNWYLTAAGGVVGGGGILPINSIRLMPFRLRARANLSQLGTRITTLSASGNLQLAIYAAQQDSLLPIGQPVARTGNIATDTAVNVAGAIVGGPVQLPRGFYWFAINNDNGVIICQVTASSSIAELPYLIGSPNQSIISSAAAAVGALKTFAATFGTWPDLSGATLAEAASNTQALGQFLVA